MSAATDPFDGSPETIASVSERNAGKSGLPALGGFPCG
jgi:hypothetical protein